MPTGSIISFKNDKGYGFIKPDDESANVYLHISALEAAGHKTIEPNQRLSYDLHTENDKTSAVNIKLL